MFPSIDERNEEDLFNVFENSHNSCDGVIRPGTFWDEDTSTIGYRSALGEAPYLRLTGFEGEYYRNMEKLPLHSKRSYRSWVRWEMIYRFAGDNFKNSKSRKEIEDIIISDLEKQIGKGNLDLYQYKKYYRDILVPSYRSFQVNLENRHGFIFNPFADTVISQSAIQAIPFLGNSLAFEVDMLRRLSPKLASMPNDYGFDFLVGEPKNVSISSLVWQMLPSAAKYPLFAMYKGNYSDSLVADLENRSYLIKEILNNVRNLELPLDIDAVAKRRIRGKLVLNLGFFIINNKQWLTC
jgi:hypothetical protein